MKKIIALVILAGLAVAGYIFGIPLYELHYSTIDLENETQEFFIDSGSNLDDIANNLEIEKVLSREQFGSFCDKLEFDESKIEPGKYILTDGMTIKSMIYGFKNGNQEVKNTRITFGNCRYVEDMAGQVAKYIEPDSSSLADLLTDPETIKKYGFRQETFISMFLPDTYEIGEWDVTSEEFVQFMADRYKEFWGENSGRNAKREKLGLEQSEVATLATIVMAEQGKFDQEWKTIAGLYLNRLEQGIKLQSDPTAKFCWGRELDTVQRILYEHLEKDCPYNTYLYTGLPPGPLRMPTKKAIDAVLDAEDNDYIFMCARPDNSGLHNFAETLEEHNRNASAFRKWMNERGL